MGDARRPSAQRGARRFYSPSRFHADRPRFYHALQKKHNKALGYFPTKQFEGYIEAGAVLVAEARHEGTEARRHEGGEEAKSGEVNSLDPSTPFPTLRASVPRDPAQREVVLRASPLGYIISRDRYLKRDELGVIYQLCVAPGFQRGLIGAALVKEVFERSAYGCRLFCCWCAQDLEANYFWESLGFVPVAFRAGSSGKKRVHIFWQRRIVENDATPWWYPFKTDSGAIREDRIVFPIPPGCIGRTFVPRRCGRSARREQAPEISFPMPGGNRGPERKTQRGDREQASRNGRRSPPGGCSSPARRRGRP